MFLHPPARTYPAAVIYSLTGRPQSLMWWAKYEPIHFDAVLTMLDGQQAESLNRTFIEGTDLTSARHSKVAYSVKAK